MLALCATSCATQGMFGAKVVSPYYMYFNNQMECAMITGWQDKPKCMCIILDPKFSLDKTFIAVEPAMCHK